MTQKAEHEAVAKIYQKEAAVYAAQAAKWLNRYVETGSHSALKYATEDQVYSSVCYESARAHLTLALHCHE